MTLEEAAALLGEDDLELEDEKMMREHLKHESKKKQKHKSLKKHGRKGRIRTANPYGDEESSRVYGVQIQIAGNKGKGSKRKQKMKAKHAGKTFRFVSVLLINYLFMPVKRIVLLSSGFT